ncbi:hypothetical protein DPEC_G00247210 [Dallia pectoralis]|uniref:Uncharacterized protein n=1 Tax=Dallia pectoralis TaxID=75939 RepID=A0ACC2FWF0_DALPE|nr:hypothetical protein DPEC_G00247210 [Dallia pectoralis]
MRGGVKQHSFNTTNMITHLKSRHPEQHQDFMKSKKEKTPAKTHKLPLLLQWQNLENTAANIQSRIMCPATLNTLLDRSCPGLSRSQVRSRAAPLRNLQDLKDLLLMSWYICVITVNRDFAFDIEVKCFACAPDIRIYNDSSHFKSM